MSLLFPRISHAAHNLPVGPSRNEWGPLFNLFNSTMDEMQRTLANTENNVQSFTPRFDVTEKKDAYRLEGEMPGIAQKDIEIEFTDERTLTIKGRSERSVEWGEKDREEEAEKANGAESKSVEVATKANETGLVTAKEHTQPTYWMAERSIGEFKRSFSFPQPVDPDAVKASLKNGILSIVVPKERKAKQTRKVAIEDAK